MKLTLKLMFAALAAVLLFTSVNARAQDPGQGSSAIVSGQTQTQPPIQNQPPSQETSVEFKPPKTLDTAFWLWTAAAYGTDVAEVEVDQACFRSGRCNKEINPLLGTGRAQEYGVSLAVTTLATYLSYRWKRHGEETVAAGRVGPKPPWWIPQLVVIGGHGVGIGVTYALRGPKP